MNKNKTTMSMSGIVKNLHPGYPNEVVVASVDGIRSVPFDELDERTQRKFSRHREQIEDYEPCFEFAEQHEFIKPLKATTDQ